MGEALVLVIMGVWDLVCVASMVAIMVSLGKQWERERLEWKEERRDLLNRIMTRTYQEFSEAEGRADPKIPIKVVSLDEIRQELNEKEEERLGMPV